MRNKVNVAIRQAKELFYKNKFGKSDGDPRKTWQVINELTSRKTGRSSVRELSLNGVSITNSTALSNAFNDHFSTIGSKLASEIPFNNGSSFQEHISGLCERFHLVSTDSNQVLCLFKKLNKPKGAGLDGISSRLILDCADLIAPQISIVFNSSLANGIFPDDWKSARVTPLFKHGERSDIDNYRQISVISIIGKVFERIIYNQLFAYLSDHSILSNKPQSGCRPLHSTVTALLEATDS